MCTRSNNRAGSPAVRSASSYAARLVRRLVRHDSRRVDLARHGRSGRHDGEGADFRPSPGRDRGRPSSLGNRPRVTNAGQRKSPDPLRKQAGPERTRSRVRARRVPRRPQRRLASLCHRQCSRRVSAGNAVLVEDTHGKGHISRHPVEEQSVILVTLPHGLDSPEFN
jgi:hypothetical protein